MVKYLVLLLFMQSAISPGRGTFVGGGLNACIVSAWAMNEGSGTTFNDTSGNTNTGTASLSDFAWTANAIKTGVTSPLWNGTVAGGAATSTTVTNFTNTQAFSAAIWVKNIAVSDANEQSFLSTLSVMTGTYQGWEISKQSSTDATPNSFTAVFVSNVGTGNLMQVTANTSINDTNLHYLVMTYNGSSNTSGIALYIDGVASSTNALFNSLTATTAGGIPVQFAQRNDGSVALFGATGYAEVYNCALTSGQVATYFARGPGIN